MPTINQSAKEVIAMSIGISFKKLDSSLAMIVVLAGLIAFYWMCLGASDWVGFGISCEPIDIKGGGFFFDVIWNAPLTRLGNIGFLKACPMFSVGPLPLRASMCTVDAFLVAEFPWSEVTFRAGLGYGLVFWIEGFQLVHKSTVFLLAFSDIHLLKNLQMYAQLRIRGEGFFASPGFGIQLTF
jgi:hypothetical protein